MSETGRRKTARSRSPGHAARARAPAADRASIAPVFIEPGTEASGVRPNTQRVFDYLAHLEKIINDHADAIDSRDVTEEILRGRIDNQLIDIANMKAIIAQNDDHADGYWLLDKCCSDL